MRNKSRLLRTSLGHSLSLVALYGALLIGPVTVATAAPGDSPNTALAQAAERTQPGSGLGSPLASDETARADRGGLRQDLPDDASNAEVKGQYGFGLISLIVGGVIATVALVSLFIFFMRRSWSASS
jgi:hypothetical protein